MLEVMMEAVDKAWWGSYRKGLQQILRQELIVIRVLPIERL